MRGGSLGAAVLVSMGLAAFASPAASFGGAGRGAAEAKTSAEAARPTVRVPRIEKPPRLEDFSGAAIGGSGAQLAEVSGFIQQAPTDGAPASQATSVYIGYDQASLYLVWVCLDSSPGQVRANISRRENILEDDYVQVVLDTFADQRHGTVFASNALGVQADGLWTEGAAAVDYTWDAVWRSDGLVTAKGYVVRMEVPFRSLRFQASPDQTWHFTLLRVIARSGEQDYWPRVSSRVAGHLNQAASLTGLAGIHPGRDLQLDPYISSRSYRVTDTRDAANPRFTSSALEVNAGIDMKTVFQGRLVLDATVNPDFSQVESDQPQVAVNQRFELYYPELRPFFLENANYFASNQGQYELTPLVFTRRIADPGAGVKLTGKLAHWTLGVLAASDQSPGELVPAADVLAGRQAAFAVAQVAHDIGEQSSVGAIYTGREFVAGYNRVGGIIASFRLGKNWTTKLHSVFSSSREPGATPTPSRAAPRTVSGYDHEAVLLGSGRRFQSTTFYQDISPGFRTDTGYLQRPDIRSLSQYFHFYSRPEHKALLSWGPETSAQLVYDHSGRLLRQACGINAVFAFKRNTYVASILSSARDILRPQDFAGLLESVGFVQNQAGFVFGTNPVRHLSLRTLFLHGSAINLVPPAGQLPSQARSTNLTQTLTLRPVSRLQVDGSYILARVTDTRSGRPVFRNHIARTKWNWQISRALSFRFTAEYEGVFPNAAASSLRTEKGLNFDGLVTYLVHPGTGVHVGYNSNLANLLPGLCARVPESGACEPGTNGPVRTPRGFINDGRQVFVKVSYLLRR